MSCTIGCCVFSRGEFLIRNAVGQCSTGFPIDCSDIGTSFKKIGNISSGLVEIQGSVIGKENEFNPALPESRSEITGVNITVSISCASSKNLLMALYSEKEIPDVDMGHVEDFCLSGDLSDCDFFPFAKKGVDLDSLVIYLKEGETVIRELESDEYSATSSGVNISTDIVIGSATNLRLAYNFDNTAFPKIEFNSETPKYKEIYFKGTNYGGDEGQLFDARFYRVLLAPVSQMDLITRDEFLTINLVGSVENSDGKWFSIVKQEE